MIVSSQSWPGLGAERLRVSIGVLFLSGVECECGVYVIGVMFLSAHVCVLGEGGGGRLCLNESYDVDCGRRSIAR